MYRVAGRINRIRVFLCLDQDLFQSVATTKIPCPVCNRAAVALAVNPNLDRLAHSLVLRVRPERSPGSGICPRCITAFRESARRLPEREPITPSNFREYRRYYLTRIESAQWNHINPDMAPGRRAQILS